MEKLGDFLSGHRNGMFGRIFLAQKLEQEIQKIAVGELKVVIKVTTVQIICRDAAYAQRLELSRRKIILLLARLAPSARFGLKIRSGQY